MSTSHEERARGQGWVPKEEWVEQGRDEVDWVDAREFNYRGELMGRISQQTRDLKQLQQSNAQRDAHIEKLSTALKALGDQNKRLAKKRIQEQREELQGIRVEAELEKDGETIRNVDRDLQELDAQERELDAMDSDPTPEPEQSQANGEGQAMTPDQQKMYAKWLVQNEWYENDVRARNYANFIAQTMDKAGKDFEQILDEVKVSVAAIFPEVNEEGEPAQKAPARQGSVMDTPASGGPTRKKGGSYASRLTKEELAIAQTFVEEGAFDSVEEYARQIAELEG